MYNGKRMMWCVLLHLGYNMWREEGAACDYAPDYTNASSKLLCEKVIWDKLTSKMAKDGLNVLIIDLGEGIKYQSHPELAVEGSWTIDQLKNELHRLRKMGITPIPKLNFSTCHDQWLGEYSHCISTKKYYEVCKNLINEVIDIFDTPKFFHLGMDEETYKHQKYYNYAVIRNGNAWWKDFYYLVDIVEKRNVQSWIWSDYIWNNEELFLRKMPKTVLQSNWYYDRSFSMDEDNINSLYVKAYKILDEYGYEQVPTGSNWSCEENFEYTVQFCKQNISQNRLKGFMLAPWAPTVSKRLYYHIDALELVRYAKKKHFE